MLSQKQIEHFKRGEFVVYCSNREEINSFLKELEEKAPDVVWGSGCKPTKYIVPLLNVVMVCKYHQLFYSRFEYQTIDGKIPTSWHDIDNISIPVIRYFTTDENCCENKELLNWINLGRKEV